jgi:dipeptidyl aminopeptidase/acylaminoacyl peptidase
MKKSAIVLFLFFQFASCNSNSSLPEPEEKSTLERQELKDISYGEFSRQKLNAFLPAKRTKETPAIIFIHGGGWQTGDKKDFDGFASAFADSAIAAFTINYRYAGLMPKVGYEQQLEDIELVIQFLDSKSREFVFNPNNICLLGHSAGGHLALLYAYRNNKNGKVDKVVSMAGPTDLTNPRFLAIEGITDLVNTLTGNDSSKREDASPLKHAKAITTHLHHGKTDAVVPYQQSEELYEKIKDMNYKNRLWLIENSGHGFSLPEFSRITIETMDLIKGRTK